MPDTSFLDMFGETISEDGPSAPHRWEDLWVHTRCFGEVEYDDGKVYDDGSNDGIQSEWMYCTKCKAELNPNFVEHLSQMQRFSTPEEKYYGYRDYILDLLED